MRYLLFSAFLLLAVPLPGQCCLGAQDSKTVSPGGRYRVEATSLNGVGPDVHGPYHFRFRSFRLLADGGTEELGSFERSWDCKKHFSMSLKVSPTGNGFLLATSLEPELRFYAPDGSVLREIPCREKHWLGWGTPPPAALQVQLKSWVDRRDAREVWLWLPLCHVIGPEMRSAKTPKGKPTPIEGEQRWTKLGDEEVHWLLRMLNWTPACGVQESDKVHAWILKLSDPDLRSEAGAALLALGLSARSELRLVAEKNKELAPIIRPILAEIRARLCGHESPWQNRDLFEALKSHPNSDLVAVARGRLHALSKEKKR